MTISRGALPYVQAVGLLMLVSYAGVQVLRNLPRNAARAAVPEYVEKGLQSAGLYARGWGMFSGHTTNTSSLRVVAVLEDGHETETELLPLRPGYLPNVWSEIMQDFQFDDNNDSAGTYRQGYLRNRCATAIGLKMVRLDQYVVSLPSRTDSPVKRLDSRRCNG